MKTDKKIAMSSKKKKKYTNILKYTKLMLAICLIQISFNFEEKKLHPNFSFLIKMFTDT